MKRDTAHKKFFQSFRPLWAALNNNLSTATLIHPALIVRLFDYSNNITSYLPDYLSSNGTMEKNPEFSLSLTRYMISCPRLVAPGMQSDAWKSREALIKPLSLRFRGVIPRCWHCASNSAKWLLAGGFWNPPERGPWPFNSNSTRVRLIVEVHVVVNDIVVVQDVSCCFVAAPHKIPVTG